MKIKFLMRYLAVGLFCLLWAGRVVVGTTQEPVVPFGVSDGHAAVTAAGLYNADFQRALIGTFSSDATPVVLGAQGEKTSLPSFKLNPYLRLLPADAPLSGRFGPGDDPQTLWRTQVVRQDRFRALLECSDYYVYALRKIVI